jgi:hypothetical protein
MTFARLPSRGFAARVARERLLYSLRQSTTMQLGLQRFKVLHMPLSTARSKHCQRKTRILSLRLLSANSVISDQIYGQIW